MCLHWYSILLPILQLLYPVNYFYSKALIFIQIFSIMKINTNNIISILFSIIKFLVSFAIFIAFSFGVFNCFNYSCTSSLFCFSKSLLDFSIPCFSILPTPYYFFSLKIFPLFFWNSAKSDQTCFTPLIVPPSIFDLKMVLL